MAQHPHPDDIEAEVLALLLDEEDGFIRHRCGCVTLFGMLDSL